MSVLVLGSTLYLSSMVQASEIKWQWANPKFGEALEDVTWGDSQFVAVGNDIVVTSPYGVEWSVAKQWEAGQARLKAVVWGNSRYVAVGESGLVLVSSDGSNWKPQTSGVTENLNDIDWTGSKYVAVGDNGTVLTSTDGASWSSHATGYSNRLLGVTHGSAGIVAVGGSGMILLSSDGNTWQQQTSPVSDDFVDVVWDGARFVAVSYNPWVLVKSHFVSSADGTNWQDDHASLNSAFAITANDAAVVSVGEGKSYVYTSDSGWSEHDIGADEDFLGIAWGDGRFVAVGKRSAIVGSLNGKNWNLLSHDVTDESLWKAGMSDSHYVVVGNNGVILNSVDGSDWSMQPSGVTASLRDVIWNGSVFVAVGAQGAVLTGPADGSNWTSQTSGVTVQLNGIAWGNSRFVAVGNNGAILSSPNGKNWSIQSSGVTENLTDVVWSGKYFIAVGVNSTILTSSDGSMWESQSTSVTDSLSGIAWNGSLFVVVTNSHTRNILTSADGRHWTVKTAPVGGARDIAWNGSLFMVVGPGGYVFSSPDGDTWTDLSGTPTSQLLVGIFWGGGQFIATGQVGAVLQGIPHFSVGGTLSNLYPVTSVVLQNNGGDDLELFNNGSFTFDTLLPDGAGYEVTVARQPVSPLQECTVSQGSGVISGADVDTVVVNCERVEYQLKVTTQGKGVVVIQPGNLQCGGDAICINSFLPGADVTLTADHDSTWEDGSLTWSGDCSGSGRTCDLTMDANRETTVQFHCLLDRVQTAEGAPVEDEQEWSCRNLEAVGDPVESGRFEVTGPNGQVTFRAEQGVRLGPGFRVGAGGRFHALVAP